jgi:dTDP-glucose 4,6-dehydratase
MSALAPERALPRRDLDEVLEVTEGTFRSLRGARVFMTGGTGFFGVWLLSTFAHARRTLDLDVDLTILTRDPDATRQRLGQVLDDAEAELVAGDVRSFAFPEGAFTHVIHGATAASAALNESRPGEMFDVIVDGTRRALELASRSGARRFLLVSSGAVYGRQPPSITNVPESHEGGPTPLDVRNAYAEGKRAAEMLTTFWAASEPDQAREAVSARGFAFVGPYLPLDVHFAIGNFIRDALSGGPIRILGDGVPYRSYMYGTDLAAWLWTLLVRGRAGAAYNVGSDDGRPLRAIAERVGHLGGAAVHVAKEATPERLAAPERYVPSIALARRELGLELRVDLDEAIRRTIAFHRT